MRKFVCTPTVSNEFWEETQYCIFEMSPNTARWICDMIPRVREFLLANGGKYFGAIHLDYLEGIWVCDDERIDEMHGVGQGWFEEWLELPIDFEPTDECARTECEKVIIHVTGTVRLKVLSKDSSDYVETPDIPEEVLKAIALGLPVPVTV